MIVRNKITFKAEQFIDSKKLLYGMFLNDKGEPCFYQSNIPSVVNIGDWILRRDGYTEDSVVSDKYFKEIYEPAIHWSHFIEVRRKMILQLKSSGLDASQIQKELEMTMDQINLAMTSEDSNA